MLKPRPEKNPCNNLVHPCKDKPKAHRDSSSSFSGDAAWISHSPDAGKRPVRKPKHLSSLSDEEYAMVQQLKQKKQEEQRKREEFARELREGPRRDELVEAAEKEPTIRDYHRERLLPFKTSGLFAALAAGGVIVNEAALEATGVSYLLPIAAGVAALGFGGSGVQWIRKRKEIPRRYRRRWGIAATLGPVWAAAATVAPSWTMAAVLAGGTYALSAKWWRENRVPVPEPYTEPEPAPAPEPVQAPQEDSIEDLWRKTIICDRGPLPGASELMNRRETEIGIEWDARVAGGKQTVQTVRANLHLIATGIDEPMTRLLVDDHPSGKPSRFRFKLIKNSPIEGDVRFTGPRYRDGLLEIGPYADGQGEALWRLYEPGGDNPLDGSAWSGVIIAATGMGKSRVLENLAISAMAPGNTVVWFLDPQDGASSPALQEYADWYVGLSGAADMLEAVKRIAKARGIENAANGRTGFWPTPERPGLLVIIDECHEVFSNKQMADEWAKLLRKMRKLGIALILVSQYSGLETFGNSEALRSSVMVGNGIVMYTASRTSGQLIAGLEVDPLTLPRLPGFGYTLRVGSFGRLAPFRNRLVKNPHEWMAKQPRVQLDELAARAAEEAYALRNNDVTQIRANFQEQLEAIRSGRLRVSDILAEEQAAMRLGGSMVPGQPVVPAQQGVQQGAVQPVDYVSLLPQWGDPITADDIPEVRPSAESLTAREQVLSVIRDGVTRKADIVAAVDVGETRVRQVLDELIESGQVVRVAHGVYEAA